MKEQEEIPVVIAIGLGRAFGSPLISDQWYAVVAPAERDKHPEFNYLISGGYATVEEAEAAVAQLMGEVH